jgi:hypothetical protein
MGHAASCICEVAVPTEDAYVRLGGLWLLRLGRCLMCSGFLALLQLLLLLAVFLIQLLGLLLVLLL